MEDCIFCKIIAGKIPCYKVYEDNSFLGFMDIKPLNIGNSLLIPKVHYRWVHDVPNFGEYFEAAKKIALATQSVVNSETTTFLTLGFEVPHAHIRIIPRFLNDAHRQGIDTQAIVQQSPDDLVRLSSRIFARINHGH